MTIDEIELTWPLHQRNAFLKQRWYIDNAGMAIWADLPHTDSQGIELPESDKMITLEVCRVSTQMDIDWKKFNGRLLSQGLNMSLLLKRFENGTLGATSLKELSADIIKYIES
jgi:hypothetical protein